MSLRGLSSFFRKVQAKLKPESQNLTHVYLYALTSIALLALVFNAIKFGLYADQAEAILAVRKVERQLLTADRLYSRLLDLQLSTDWESKKKSIESNKDTARVFFAAHSKISELEFFQEFCEQANCSPQRFDSLRELVDGTIRLDSEWAELAQNEVRDYKTFLEKANIYLDDSASKTNNDLILLDIAFLACLLFFLLFQATFIFKPAVSRLDHALSVRSEFLSRISHEIRNPMNAVLGMAEVLKSTRLNFEQRQYLDSLLRAGQTLLEMLNNLIDVSAVEGKSIQIKAAPFEIHEMIDKTSQVVSSLAHHKGVEFFVKVDPQVKRSYRSDVVRLEQVLINLLNNAVKFTPRGYVMLELELIATIEQKSRIRFSVKDTGIGIDKTKTQDIFNSFVQEDSSIKRQYGGSGLGLSIASEILKMMGAKLQVESEKGSGSHFFFEIDLEHVLTSEDSVFITAPEKPVILITGQYDTIMRSILTAYSPQNMVFETVDGLKEYLKEEKKIFHIVVDDSLGIINMISVHETIIENGLSHSLTALLKTSFPKENIDLIRKSGYSNFMLKPFRPWILSSFEEDAQSLIEPTNSVPQVGAGENFRFPLRVLAVDDSEDNLFLVREILTPMVQKIDFARNGQEAVDMVQDNKYDIIFMDIQMPVMDGYTAIRRIRKLDEHSIPVIAVTAHGGVIDEKKCLEAGFSARLVKPIGREHLKNILLEFFSGKKIEIQEKTVTTHNDKIDPMIEKLLPTFFSTRDSDMGFVKDALEKRDFDQLKALGHKVKGSSLSYGFENLGEKGRALEIAALENDIETCEKLYNELVKDLEAEKSRHLHS